MDVGLRGISLFSGMARDQPIGVTCLACFHGGRAGAQLLEESGVPIFVSHIVALEHNTPFELPVGVTSSQFTAFFDANLKDHAYVDRGVVATSTGSHLGPFTHLVFVPTPRLTQLSPLLQEGFLCCWGGTYLSLAHRSGNSG